MSGEVRTNRLLSLLAAILLAAGPFAASEFFQDRPNVVAFIGMITTMVAGALVPASASPFGTVDAVPPDPPVRVVEEVERPAAAMPQRYPFDDR